MSNLNSASAYQSQAVQTANRPRLLVMLLDRLAVDIDRADHAIESLNYETVNETLQHAQKIVRMLASSLDPEGFSGAQDLLAVYDFLERHLIAANLEKSATKVKECADMVRPIHEAWRRVVNASERENAHPHLD